VVPAFKAIAALLHGDFSGALGYAKQAVSGMAKFVLSIFTKLPGQVLGALAPLAGKVWSAAKSAGSKLVSATKQGISDAIGWLKGLPGRAKGALGSLGGVLLGAGKSLISGFVSGIKSMFGSVKSTLGGLTSKLTSWKGPAPLDKKILTPNGRMVIQGFQRGITKQVPHLKKQLQTLTRRQIPSMAAALEAKGVAHASVASAKQALRLDITGSDAEMKALVRKMFRVDGRGFAPMAAR
jgi:hypothetical protein